MPLNIIRQDITKLECDAIVNAANNTLLGGGGVDGAIHRAAGPNLLRECETLGGCETGKAKITKGYDLPAKYVIHTVGPVWEGGFDNEPELLRSCYENCLRIAKEKELKSIAFPMISTGAYDFPIPLAMEIATSTISDFFEDNEMMVYIVTFSKFATSIASEKFHDLQQFIDDNYVNSSESYQRLRNRPDYICHEIGSLPPSPMMAQNYSMPPVEKDEKKAKRAPKRALKCTSIPDENLLPVQEESSLFEEAPAELGNIDDYLHSIEFDESLAEMIDRIINEKNIKPSECYKRGNVSKSVYSKIHCEKDYKPKKEMVIGIAIGLQLSLSEAESLLKKAGYALSESNLFDVIIRYFFLKKVYDVITINEVMFDHDLMLVGSSAI